MNIDIKRKGKVFIMLMKKLENATEVFARKNIEKGVGGQTACWFFHQPKLPKGAEKFKAHNK